MRLSYPAAVTHHLPTPSSVLPTGGPAPLPPGSRGRSLFSTTKRGLLAVAVGLLGTGAAHAQINYRPAGFTSVTSAFTDISATGTAITTANTDDANSAATPIGFSFTYDGASMSHFILNTNGLMKLGGSAAMAAPSSAALYYPYANSNSNLANTAFGGVFVSSSGADTYLMAPFHVDLQDGSLPGGATYQVRTTGTSPNQVCTIQWTNVQDKPRAQSATTATPVPNNYATFSFQVKLYETTNRIEFVYGAPTLSGSASVVAKFSEVGLRGNSTAATRLMTVTKGSITAWASPSSTQNAAYTGNSFNFRQAAVPVVGQTYRFTPSFNDDASVAAVYTLNKLPIPSGAPHTVRAAITNVGLASTTASTATLTITGPAGNAFVTTQAVPVIPVGFTATITFATYTPTANGTNTVTVSLSGDENTSNDTRSETQEVSANDYSYINPALPVFTANGFAASASVFANLARFTTSTALSITGVRAQIVDFVGTATATNDVTVGQTVYGVLVNPVNGAVLAQSPDYVVTAADVAGNGTLKAFTFTTPVILAPGAFMVGLASKYATGATKTYFPLGSQFESPDRGTTFYTEDLAAPAAPVVRGASTSNRLMLEAITAAAPACVPPTALVAGSITDVSASLSFGTNAVATGGYTINYTPSGGSLQTTTSAGSPVVLTGLTPGTTYAVDVISNCGGGQTSTTSTSFTTRFTNDAQVTNIYTLGRLAIPFGAPHAVRARILNVGQDTLTNLNVFLNISGANTFSNTQVVATLLPGASTVVTFDDFTPTVSGTNTVTVSAADDNAANNANQSQNVNTTTIGYAIPGVAPASQVGFVGGDFLVASRFTASVGRTVTAVNVTLATSSTVVGQTVYGVLLDAAGLVVGRSPDYVVGPTDAGTQRTFTLTAPVIIDPGVFHVGLVAKVGGYFAVSAQAETPTRTGAFFVSFNAAGGGLADLSATNNRRLMIEAVTANLPACLPPSAVVFTNPATTSVTISYNASGTPSPDGYTIAYTPAGGGATQTVTTTALTRNITGLVAGTTYNFTVTTNCNGGAISPSVLASFSTIPANDQCAGAIGLGCGSTVNGTTLGSTSTNDPAAGSVGNVTVFPAAGGVFYRFFGTGEQTTFSLCTSANTAFDSQMIVYSGTCAALTPVGTSDDFCGALSEVTVITNVGTTYYIFVTGFVNGGIPSRSAFTLTASCVPLPNLTVSATTPIAGAYNNVTVTGPNGIASLSGNLQVQGTLTVQSGGRLTLDPTNAIFGSGGINVQAGATLSTTDAVGFTNNNGAGSFFMSGPVTLSNDASYIYNGTLAQVTGPLLPSIVRNLTVNNTAGIAANRRLTLSGALGIRQLLNLQSGSLITNGNTFTLRSNATDGQAMVVNNGTTNVVTGTTTVECFVSSATNGALGYRHFSSPVTGAPVTSMGNAFYGAFPAIYRYDETLVPAAVPAPILLTSPLTTPFDLGWVSTGAAATMAPGAGYTILKPNAAAASFTGTLNTGNIGPLAVSNTAGLPGATGSGWNFLGNGYPSPLNADLMMTTGFSANVEQSISVWRSRPFTISGTAQVANGQYVVRTPFGGTTDVSGANPADPFLAVGQPFFVHATGSGSVTMTNAMRPTTYLNKVHYRPAVDVRPRVTLGLASASGQQLTDYTLLVFDATATAGFDNGYDGHKMFNVGGVPSIATMMGTEQLAINVVGELSARTVVPVAVMANKAGSYKLTAGLTNLPAGTRAYLMDAFTGTRQDLTQNATYACLLDAGIQTQRFSLVFEPAASPLATATDVAAAAIAVYPNPSHGSFRVNIPVGVVVTQAVVVDALGRIVAQPLTGGAEIQVQQTLPVGVYTLRLDTNVGTVVRKVVIQ